MTNSTRAFRWLTGTAVAAIGFASMAAAAQTSPVVPSPSGTTSATAAAGASAPQETGGLDEIIVTAQRRTENLQRVPLSIVAVGEDQIKTQGIRTLEQLNQIAPNALVERVGLFPGAASLSIRGIGYGGIESFTDPDVAVYVNGIYQARNAAALSQTLDVTSIEVLRGPQGTLFGRNAYAGAVSVQTARPQMTKTTASGTATVGNYGLVDLDLIGNVPIVDDKLAARVAVRSHNLAGLYRNNGITSGVAGPVDPGLAGKRIGKEKSLLIRPSLRFTPTDRLDIQLLGEFLREDDQAAPIPSIPIQGGSLITVFGGYQHNPYGDKSAGIAGDGTDPIPPAGPGLGPMKFHTDNVTLDAKYDTGIGSLRLLGNISHTKSEVWTDGDGSVANIFSTARYEDYYARSAELQFVSDFSDRFNLVAGLFGFHDKYQTTQGSLTAFTTNSPPIFNQANYLNPAAGQTTATCGSSLNPVTGHYTVVTTGCTYPGYTLGYLNNSGKRNAYAAYFQGEYHVTPELSVVAGLRYSYERKYDYFGYSTTLGASGLSRFVDFRQHLDPLDASLRYTAAPLTSGNFAPRLGVNYRASNDVLLFAFWQRAFKSGGFNAGVADAFAFATPYGVEKVDNFEGGIKSEFLDHKLRVNVQGFYAKYTDLQRSQITPSPTAVAGVVNVVSNTSDIISYGIESEIAAKPVRQLTIFANIGWNKARYTRYCADLNGPEAVANPTGLAPNLAVCGPTSPAPGNTVLVPQDYSAKAPIRAPRWDITAGIVKDITIDRNTLSLSGSMNHRSSMYVDLLNRVYSYRPAMTVLDASIKFAPNDGRYSITAWGRNLTNNVQILGYVPVSTILAFGAPTTPRTYGVTASVNF